MKSRTKNLGLAGVILGTSVLSSCQGLNDSSVAGMALSAIGVHRGNPVAQVIGGQLSQYGAAQAGASNVNVYVNGNSNSRVPRAQSFVFSRWIDNGDGCFELSEAKGIGRSVFYKDESITYAIAQNGCKGRTLRLYLQSTPESPLREFMSSFIEKDSSYPQTRPMPLSGAKSGIYRSVWTLDGVNIGEHLIEIRER